MSECSCKFEKKFAKTLSIKENEEPQIQKQRPLNFKKCNIICHLIGFGRHSERIVIATDTPRI